MPCADSRRPGSVVRWKPFFLHPHDLGDTSKCPPAAGFKTIHVLELFAGKPPPYHVADDDVKACVPLDGRLEATQTSGHRTVHERGGGGAHEVVYETHLRGILGPSVVGNRSRPAALSLPADAVYCPDAPTQHRQSCYASTGKCVRVPRLGNGVRTESSVSFPLDIFCLRQNGEKKNTTLLAYFQFVIMSGTRLRMRRVWWFGKVYAHDDGSSR